jgi:phasin family protein
MGSVLFGFERWHRQADGSSLWKLEHPVDRFRHRTITKYVALHKSGCYCASQQGSKSGLNTQQNEDEPMYDMMKTLMNNEMLTKYNEQAEQLVMGPSRSYAKLAVDYAEKMVNAQMEAAKTYTDIGMRQARAALDIKDAEALKAYADEQQAVAKDVSERVKSDAEKVVGMNQQFADEARKLVESSVKAASETATENVNAAQKAAKAS